MAPTSAQVARAFVRASGDAARPREPGPDFLQLKVTSGRVGIDLRSLDPGTAEVDTPQAALTSTSGYYNERVQDRTPSSPGAAGRPL
jgi:hypothetical protein